MWFVVWYDMSMWRQQYLLTDVRIVHLVYIYVMAALHYYYLWYCCLPGTFLLHENNVTVVAVMYSDVVDYFDYSCCLDCRARRMLHYFDFCSSTTSELRVLLYEYVLLPAADGSSS